MRLALFQPDIPQNTGTLLRLGACMGVGVDIIEPCGFLWDDRKLKRAGMDYLDHVEMKRHASWQSFLETRPPGRLILLTTKAETAYTDFAFLPTDLLVLGRESSGVPSEVRQAVDAAVKIPTAPGTRSLNLALAGAMVLGEALRQGEGFPRDNAMQNTHG